MEKGCLLPMVGLSTRLFFCRPQQSWTSDVLRLNHVEKLRVSQTKSNSFFLRNQLLSFLCIEYSVGLQCWAITRFSYTGFIFNSVSSRLQPSLPVPGYWGAMHLTLVQMRLISARYQLSWNTTVNIFVTVSQSVTIQFDWWLYMAMNGFVSAIQTAIGGMRYKLQWGAGCGTCLKQVVQ